MENTNKGLTVEQEKEFIRAWYKYRDTEFCASREGAYAIVQAVLAVPKISEEKLIATPSDTA